MTMHEPTPAADPAGAGRRRTLHDVTRLEPATRDAAHDPERAAASIRAQVQQVEALLTAVREQVGSLARASLRLEREVEQSLQPAAQPRAERPSTAHPAQAAVERASLLEAVENRAVIEQAKGMLMLKHRCDAEAAFGLLVEISRRERRKVRDIAGDIVRSGTRPRRVVDVTDAAVTSGRVADQARAR